MSAQDADTRGVNYSSALKAGSVVWSLAVIGIAIFFGINAYRGDAAVKELRQKQEEVKVALASQLATVTKDIAVFKSQTDFLNVRAAAATQQTDELADRVLALTVNTTGLEGRITNAAPLYAAQGGMQIDVGPAFQPIPIRQAVNNGSITLVTLPLGRVTTAIPLLAIFPNLPANIKPVAIYCIQNRGSEGWSAGFEQLVLGLPTGRTDVATLTTNTVNRNFDKKSFEFTVVLLYERPLGQMPPATRQSPCETLQR